MILTPHTHRMFAARIAEASGIETPVEKLQQTSVHQLAGIAEAGNGRSTQAGFGRVCRLPYQRQWAVEAKRKLAKLAMQCSTERQVGVQNQRAWADLFAD